MGSQSHQNSFRFSFGFFPGSINSLRGGIQKVLLLFFFLKISSIPQVFEQSLFLFFFNQAPVPAPPRRLPAPVQQGAALPLHLPGSGSGLPPLAARGHDQAGEQGRHQDALLPADHGCVCIEVLSTDILEVFFLGPVLFYSKHCCSFRALNLLFKRPNKKIF